MNTERFWAKVDRSEEGCWLWLGGTDKDGYGRYGNRPSLNKAHRIAYALTYGEPGKLHVLHKCDVPGCCRPDHLFIGTVQDNMVDRNMKGHTTKGEKNRHVKLTDDQVVQIRQEGAWASQSVIAKKWGVGQTQISRLLRQVQR